MIKTINVIYLEQSDTLNDDFFLCSPYVSAKFDYWIEMLQLCITLIKSIRSVRDDSFYRLYPVNPFKNIICSVAYSRPVKSIPIKTDPHSADISFEADKECCFSLFLTYIKTQTNQ